MANSSTITRAGACSEPDQGLELPQHLEALAKANEIRLERARLHRLVEAGELTVKDVLLDHPRETRTLTIGALIRWQNRWGKTRTNKLLGSIGLTTTKTIGSMTDRQKWLVIRALQGGASNDCP